VIPIRDLIRILGNSRRYRVIAQAGRNEAGRWLLPRAQDVLDEHEPINAKAECQANLWIVERFAPNIQVIKIYGANQTARVSQREQRLQPSRRVLAKGAKNWSFRLYRKPLYERRDRRTFFAHYGI